MMDEGLFDDAHIPSPTSCQPGHDTDRSTILQSTGADRLASTPEVRGVSKQIPAHHQGVLTLGWVWLNAAPSTAWVKAPGPVRASVSIWDSSYSFFPACCFIRSSTESRAGWRGADANHH